MKYTGIDLHSNNSVISVINETDKVVAEKRLEHAKQMVLSKRNKTRIRNLTTEKEQAVQDLVEVQAALKVTSRDYKKALKAVGRSARC
jgi:hypothetical protein